MLERMLGRHGDVVKKAKPHGACTHGVVPRRSHAAKCIVHLTGHHQVGRKHRRAGAAQQGLPCARAHRRVRIDVHDPGLWRRVADFDDVIHRMHALDIGQPALRRIDARQ